MSEVEEMLVEAEERISFLKGQVADLLAIIQEEKCKAGHKRIPFEALWCTSRLRNKGQKNGWAFPPDVERLIKRQCEGKKVLSLFGGITQLGTRLDIDPIVRPDVIGDAWLPPFCKNSFDVVLLDPPYAGINQQQKLSLLIAASWVARERLIWFHTMWLDNEGPFMKLERAWLVRVGRNCHVRALEIFKVSKDKREPDPWFRRGPQIRYNRWLVQPQGFPFGKSKPESQSK